MMITTIKVLAEQLKTAQQELEQRPVASILKALEQVAANLSNPVNPLRQEAEQRLSGATGLSRTMLGWGIESVMCRVRSIGQLLDQDLGNREVLDRYIERAPGVCSRAWGPRLVVCLFAGNVPAVAAFDMALALALKSACLARPSQAEPHFSELFARAVCEVDPLLSRSLAVALWPYDDAEPYRQAGAVVAYGSDATITAVRQLVPEGVRFVGHGHRIGFAVVAREASTVETARLLALDVALFDQQGCVSPHMVYVERGGPLAPVRFAQACGEALAELERSMPRSLLNKAEAMAFRVARDEAEFAADALFASPDSLHWAVVHGERPAFEPSPLNRLLRCYGVDGVDDVTDIVSPARPWLQTAAFAGPPERRDAFAATMGALGVSRICPVGKTQTPGALWRHDGRLSAGELVRWTDVEE